MFWEQKGGRSARALRRGKSVAEERARACHRVDVRFGWKGDRARNTAQANVQGTRVGVRAGQYTEAGRGLTG